jgi:integrase/recombinase XerD
MNGQSHAGARTALGLAGPRGFEPPFSGSEGLLLGKEEHKQVISRFKEFCEVDLQLSERTVYGHVRQIKRFLKSVDGFSRDDIRGFLRGFKDRSPSTYSNVLKSLRRFFRDFLRRPDLVESFRLPHREVSIKIIPSRSDLKQFYKGLKSVRDKALFLLYASSGLRASEVLKLKHEDIDFGERRVLLGGNGSRTKRSWISFYNIEAEKFLEKYLVKRNGGSERLFPISRRRLATIFKQASKRSGVSVSPQRLREWFCAEMGRLGVPDRYVDAFCGRVPKSVLARHYSDYSPEKLKEIYENADLKILN